jgi:hypothetical protein
MDRETARAKRSLRSKLLTALMTVLLLLGGVEATARLALQVQPNLERFQLNHDLGWEWTPGYDPANPGGRSGLGGGLE